MLLKRLCGRTADRVKGKAAKPAYVTGLQLFCWKSLLLQASGHQSTVGKGLAASLCL